MPVRLRERRVRPRRFGTAVSDHSGFATFAPMNAYVVTLRGEPIFITLVRNGIGVYPGVRTFGTTSRL